MLLETKVSTAIRYTQSQLKAFTQMTYVLNPNWKAEDYNQPTLPIAMFYVSEMPEEMKSNVNMKNVIVNTSQSDISKSGISQIICDNIVAEPKQWNVSAILPFDIEDCYRNFFQQNSAVISRFLKTENYLGYIDSDISKLVKNIIKPIIEANYASGEQFLSSVVNIQGTQRNSLVAMYESKALLQMKLWTGWQFVYGVITDLKFNKKPTENNVYRIQFTLQEIPILFNGDESTFNKDITKPVKSVSNTTGKVYKDTFKLLGGLL